MLGIVVFALGILISVCLHEAGHMVTAKAFGMKVTRYFVGFGPTLWSFRRGETEYGVKAHPARRLRKIVGMTPQDDDVDPGDEKRAMWRYPVWKRTIVMSAGSATHFLLGIVILWWCSPSCRCPTRQAADRPVTIDQVPPCVATTWEFDPATKQPGVRAGHRPGQPGHHAWACSTGDQIMALNGTQITGWDALTAKSAAAGGQDGQLTVLARRPTSPRPVTPGGPAVQPDVDDPNITSSGSRRRPGARGRARHHPTVPETVLGPVAAFGMAGTRPA